MLTLLVGALSGQLNFKHFDDPACIGGFPGVPTHNVPDTSKCHYILPSLAGLTGEWIGGGMMNGKCEFCYSTYSEKECNSCLAKKAQAEPCSSGNGQCSGICPFCWEVRSPANPRPSRSRSARGGRAPSPHVPQSPDMHRACRTVARNGHLGCRTLDVLALLAPRPRPQSRRVQGVVPEVERPVRRTRQ